MRVQQENSETPAGMSRCFCFRLRRLVRGAAEKVIEPFAHQTNESSGTLTEVMMKKYRVRGRGKFYLIWFLALASPGLFSVSPSLSATDKITPEELVARHLESIGPAQTRAAVKTRIIAGNALVIFRTPPPGQAGGKAVLASEGVKSLIGFAFPSPIYPREQLIFNGNNFNAAYVTPGTRSVLGNFLMTHSLVFKEGVMGGTLSSAWALADLSTRKPQLEYAGTRKIGDRTLHQLKYSPRGGSDLQIRLFFDQDSYRHVRTEYERVIPAPTGTVEYSNIQEREIRYKMIEEFSAFKQEGGLMLPHSYKITLTVDSQGGTFLAEWQISLTRFSFNEPLDPNSFNLTAN